MLDIFIIVFVIILIFILKKELFSNYKRCREITGLTKKY